jgi:predicted acylesterase/phospholipase RssA
LGEIGIVLSGGGSRAAYQVGVLRALSPFLGQTPNPISVITGSSIGAINGLMLGSMLKHGYSTALSTLEEVWRERTFRNTFHGTPSQSFFKAVRLAVVQYLQPGPHATDDSIFNPKPLVERVDGIINGHGGLAPADREPSLLAIAVMTTVEGSQRKPLLFVSSHKKISDDAIRGATFEVCYAESLHAKHGFASAALPSVLPPVELDTEQGKVRLVDGGISINVPVDPCVRLGARKIILIDISGRDWWLRQYNEPGDTRPTWEVASAPDTFCMRPPESFVVRPRRGLGEILRAAVGNSTKQFMSAIGPTWPVFQLLKRKLGEEIAYETMSYVALDREYLNGLIEQGYNDTMRQIRSLHALPFSQEAAITPLSKAG